jgi:hypothetical protein
MAVVLRKVRLSWSGVLNVNKDLDYTRDVKIDQSYAI